MPKDFWQQTCSAQLLTLTINEDYLLKRWHSSALFLYVSDKQTKARKPRSFVPNHTDAWSQLNNWQTSLPISTACQMIIRTKTKTGALWAWAERRATVSPSGKGWRTLKSASTSRALVPAMATPRWRDGPLASDSVLSVCHQKAEGAERPVKVLPSETCLACNRWVNLCNQEKKCSRLQ